MPLERRQGNVASSKCPWCQQLYFFDNLELMKRFVFYIILSVFLGLNAFTQDNSLEAFRMQVLRDTSSIYSDLARSAKILAELYGWRLSEEKTKISTSVDSQFLYGGMTKKEHERLARSTLRSGGSVHWSRNGGVYFIQGTGDSDLDNQIFNAMQGGAIPYGAPVNLIEDYRSSIDEQSEVNADILFRASVDYHEARRNAGLTYNKDFEPMFSNLDTKKSSKPLNRKQQPKVSSNQIYPDGKVNTSCVITPMLKLAPSVENTSIEGQIRITLLNELIGEPIVSIYILGEEVKKGRKTGDYIFKYIGIRPKKLSSFRPSSEQNWDYVNFRCRLKSDDYYNSGDSLEELSMYSKFPFLTKFTINETTPARELIRVHGKKFKIAIYHIEVWHGGKCIGVKDGQLGTGIMKDIRKDWFIQEYYD